MSPRGGSQSDLRTANRQRVIDTLSRRGALTQADIARMTGLAASTVSNIVSDLSDLNLIRKEDSLGGPHGQQISLVPTAGLVLGIELGHRHLTLAIANLAHDIVAYSRSSLPHAHSRSTDLALLNSELDTLVNNQRIKRSDILCAGLALPAPIDLAQRRITSNQVMPSWANIDAVEATEKALGLPVYLDNDANLGAVGEQVWGAGKGIDDLVYLKLSDGIGSGLVLGGQLYRGADGSAGEVGHITIDERGAMCRCGNRGCLETVASVPAIVQLMRPVFGPDVTIEDIIQLAHEGNTACIRVLEDTGRLVGMSLANIANTVNPRAIILGGSLAEAGDILIGPLQTVLSRYAVRGVAENLQFMPAALGIRSHVLGAVSLALTHAPTI
ncbi:MAG: ROK family transcriptional regulator [Actinomycetaceae bacterium]|nr:ROK family transcriptional regulator [Actinomycetaceae bacterium]